MIKIINPILKHFNLKITSVIESEYIDILDKEFLEIHHQIKEYTMTSIPNQYATYQAVKYSIENNILGDFIECGVWRGGCSLIAAILYQKQGIDKKVYLYDTFEGMSSPTELDTDLLENQAKNLLENQDKNTKNSIWCYASIDDVKNNFKSCGITEDRFELIKGKVEDTIPKMIKTANISVLRLDTDWYESTKHEMEFLFPLLVNKGVLIIDDYGHWQGARKAIDEYFHEKDIKPYLHRVDYTCRSMIKLN
jgi:hypothetical protein